MTCNKQLIEIIDLYLILYELRLNFTNHTTTKKIFFYFWIISRLPTFLHVLTNISTYIFYWWIWRKVLFDIVLISWWFHEKKGEILPLASVMKHQSSEMCTTIRNINISTFLFISSPAMRWKVKNFFQHFTFSPQSHQIMWQE